MSIVLACDPGKHSGLALFVDGDLLQTELLFGSLAEQGKTLRWLLYAHRRRTPPATLVLEAFRNAARGMSRDMIDTVKLIGFIEGTARLYGWQVVLQMPPVKRPYLEDARLLAPYVSEHERDAIGHALSYFAKTNHLGTLQSQQQESG